MVCPVYLLICIPFSFARIPACRILHHSALQAVEFDRDLICRYDGKGPRYTSYPTADRFVSTFGAADHARALHAIGQGAAAKPLSLYFHIPFCNTVCYYCACNKVITKDRAQADRYLDHLIREIHLQADLLPYRAQVQQLHLGGGTPTFLSDAQFVRLMDAVTSRFDLCAGGELLYWKSIPAKWVKSYPPVGESWIQSYERWHPGFFCRSSKSG